MAKRANIVLVDDEEALRVAAERILRKEGYQVAAFSNAKDGLAAVLTDDADLLLTDLHMPEMDGIELLQRAKEKRPTLEVVMITGQGTIENAVEAMRLGAYDFIEKPIDRAILLKAISKALEKQRLVAENRQLRAQLHQQHSEDALIGNSPAMAALKTLIRQVAPTDVTVLIQGESGTGKEVVADIIHALSPRRDHPIAKISCAAIPENLLESELFGYEKGAFTGAVGSKPGKFELANGGSLFLDEIAEMSPALQAKLLRVLQDRRFQRVGGTADIEMDVRVISATHVNLPVAIEEKKFRADLYYRLNVMPITLPPLRDRCEDIPLLADHFLKKHATRMQKTVVAIAPSALSQLMAHYWPGNVRELENVIQRALAVTAADEIESFQLLSSAAATTASAPSGPTIAVPVGTPMAEVEERMIAATLKQVGGNKEKAAKILGVSVRTLYRRSTDGGVP